VAGWLDGAVVWMEEVQDEYDISVVPDWWCDCGRLALELFLSCPNACSYAF
jgi:hypothetical protein